MSEYFAEISWELSKDDDFLENKYSRGHRWHFDGGFEMPASASPHIVPAPWSVAASVDPEEAFVASLSSCHMLWFLSVASKGNYEVQSYRDKASGVLAKNPNGQLVMTEVTLRPGVNFATDSYPSRKEIAALHHQAHTKCFLANSVKTDVKVEPAWPDS